MILCSSCGRSLYPGQNFCLECGALVSASGVRDEQPVVGREINASALPHYNPSPKFYQASVLPQAAAQKAAVGRGHYTILIACGLLATAVISAALTVIILKSRSESPAQNAGAYPASNYSSPGESPQNSKPTRMRITATASSVRSPMRDIYYDPSNVLDGDWRTGWVEGAAGPGIGEWIRCDFDREVKLRKIIITPGYFKTSRLWAENNRLASAAFYFSDGTSRSFSFPDRMEIQTLQVSGVKTRWVKMVLNSVYPGSVDSEDTPISEISFDWEE